MDKYLEKMGSNFAVAAVIPSLAFVTLCTVIFGPIIPEGVTRRLESTFNPLGQSWLLLLVATVIIGFTLSSLNTFIYKIFEGYWLIARLPFFRKSQQAKARNVKQSLVFIRKRITQLIEMGAQDSEIQAQLDEFYYVQSEYDQFFPHSEQAILPTRFGNRFRAAEDYPASRYGIDSVRMWPRLIHVIPLSYQEKLDQSNNQLGFLINCSVLALLLVVMCISASLYQFFYAILTLVNLPSPFYFVSVNVTAGVYLQRTGLYLFGSVFSLLGAVFFYYASLPVVSQYGNLIRSAYDLFRFDLLKALHLELPCDGKEEYDIWRKVCEFVACGDPNGNLEFKYFEY